MWNLTTHEDAVAIDPECALAFQRMATQNGLNRSGGGMAVAWTDAEVMTICNAARKMNWPHAKNSLNKICADKVVRAVLKANGRTQQQVHNKLLNERANLRLNVGIRVRDVWTTAEEKVLVDAAEKAGYDFENGTKRGGTQKQTKVTWISEDQDLLEMMEDSGRTEMQLLGKLNTLRKARRSRAE